jgi:uncharacterized protein YkwD
MIKVALIPGQIQGATTMNAFENLLEWFTSRLRKRPVPNPTPTPPPTPTPQPTPTPGVSVGPEILEESNLIRAVNGKTPLKWNSILEADAQSHASRMASLHDMNHHLPGEPDMGQRLKVHGYIWSWAAENIAAGYMSVKTVMAGWRMSPDHLANILGPSTEMGAAMVVGNNGVPYWSVTFARPMTDFMAPVMTSIDMVPLVIRSEDGTMSSMRMIPKFEGET